MDRTQSINTWFEIIKYLFETDKLREVVSNNPECFTYIPTFLKTKINTSGKSAFEHIMKITKDVLNLDHLVYAGCNNEIVFRIMLHYVNIFSNLDKSKIYPTFKNNYNTCDTRKLIILGILDFIKDSINPDNALIFTKKYL